jgi:hypothetical protein
MKRFVLFLFLSLNFTVFSQENAFFIKLAQKPVASFNDAITLMKLMYDEKDNSDVFIDNVLWAAGKKLFQVTIPIKPDEINPAITRKEFAYWCCQVFNLRSEVKKTPTTRYLAYNLCAQLGIIDAGRGQDDTFTGSELIDTFSYLDYYVKVKNIKPNPGMLNASNDDYEYIPEWRKKIYRELDEQQKQEKLLREQNKGKTFNKKKPDTQNPEIKEINKDIREKYIDNSSDAE